MTKFDAPKSLNMEIARLFRKPGNYTLNRPLVMLLEGLGVPYAVFEKLQDDAVQHVKDSTSSFSRMSRLLETHGLGTSYRLSSVLSSLSKIGVEILDDLFYRRMTAFAVNHVLRDYKYHCRIPVPGGWTLVGVADVFNVLRCNEIFACVWSDTSAKKIYLEGDVVISRSPTIHPGDVQIVRAIGRPPPNSPYAREPLPNTVVFSTQGTALILFPSTVVAK